MKCVGVERESKSKTEAETEHEAVFEGFVESRPAVGQTLTPSPLQNTDTCVEKTGSASSRQSKGKTSSHRKSQKLGVEGHLCRQRREAHVIVFMILIIIDI